MNWCLYDRDLRHERVLIKASRGLERLYRMFRGVYVLGIMESSLMGAVAAATGGLHGAGLGDRVRSGGD